MPQAQVLPYVPNFGEKFSSVLGEGVSKVADAYQRKSAQETLKRLLNPQQTQDQQSPIQQNGLQTALSSIMGMDSQTPPSPMQQVSAAAQSAQPGQEIKPFELAQIGAIADRAYGKGTGDTLVKGYIEQQKIAAKEASALRLEEHKRKSALTQKAAEEKIGQRESFRKQRIDLNLAEQAIESGDVGGFDINHFANLIGGAAEPFKNLAGVQLDSAMKNFLINDIRSLAGRPNQWIEQQIKGAIPGVGKSAEANQTLIKIAKSDLDLKEKILDIEDGIVNYYEQRGLPPPSNLDQLSHQVLKPYAELVEQKLGYDLRVIYEKSKGEKGLKSIEKVPQGTPLTKEKLTVLKEIYGGDVEKAIKNAKRLGYVIPDPKIFNPNFQELENAD